MRTQMKNWLKVAFALLMVSAIVGPVSADEKDDTKEKAPKVKRNRTEERRMNSIHRTLVPVEGFNPVEMFEAVEAGDVEVVIKPFDAVDSNLIVTNNTDKPLAIQMPEAFSAVPILRQGGLAGGGIGGLGGGGFGGGGLGGGLGGGGLGGGGFGGGGNQGVGGGFGGGLGGGGFGGGGLGGGGLGGGGLGGGGIGGGVFNIPPGRVGKLSMKTFCLEEGKEDPELRIKYTIQPLEKLNSDPKVFEMCRMLANDEITQPVAQAAAWNVANGLSWEYLLHKNRIERMDGSFERFFHPMQLRYAQQVTVAADQRAKLRAEAMKNQEKKESDEDRYNARYNSGR